MQKPAEHHQNQLDDQLRVTESNKPFPAHLGEKRSHDLTESGYRVPLGTKSTNCEEERPVKSTRKSKRVLAMEIYEDAKENRDEAMNDSSSLSARENTATNTHAKDQNE